MVSSHLSRKTVIGIPESPANTAKIGADVEQVHSVAMQHGKNLTFPNGDF
jgi:hypothetical protein